MISTLSSLDRREFSHFTLDVEASDDVNLSRATLQIYVDDVNDNFPRFLSETLRFAVVPAGSKQGNLKSFVCVLLSDSLDKLLEIQNSKMPRRKMKWSYLIEYNTTRWLNGF